jgi:type II secretory pathway pseudopilin PulG
MIVGLSMKTITVRLLVVGAAAALVTPSLRAQDANQIDQLKQQLRQMQENFERVQREQREQIETLTKKLDDLTKQQAAEAERRNWNKSWRPNSRAISLRSPLSRRQARGLWFRPVGRPRSL